LKYPDIGPELSHREYFQTYRNSFCLYTALKPTGKAIQHFYANEVNSVVTYPCPERPWTDLKKGDIVEIEGLAWSGMGTITEVDISLDGGDNWEKASLKGLVLEKSWTRFSFMHEYTGKPLLLSSRAVDDAGHVQPTVREERAVNGIESVYHRNGIHTWKVSAKGEVTNVQILSQKNYYIINGCFNGSCRNYL